MLAVLRQRNFALVWVAGLISLTGDRLFFVAVPLVVYQLTGSTVATAAAVASRVLPRLALGSVAGVFVDRWDRRRTMLVANLLLGLCLLPLLLVRSAEWLWLLYLVSFIQAILAQFLGSAEDALLPRLVAEADLVPANALNGLNNELARLAGPPLGGLVVTGWGLTGAALLDAASFFAAAGLVALVAVGGRADRADRAGAPSIPAASGGAGVWAAMWHEWAAGLALVRRVRPVAVVFLFMALTGVGEGAMAALFVPFVAMVLGGGGVAYGAIMAAQAVGGLAGNAVIGRLGRGTPPARLLGMGALAAGAIDLMTFNAHRVVPGVLPPIALMVIVGLPFAGIHVGRATLIQTAVADEYRGRVFGSIRAVSALGVLAGAGLAGVLGDRLGIVATLTLDGAAYLLGGALALLALAPRPVPSIVRTADAES